MVLSGRGSGEKEQIRAGPRGFQDPNRFSIFSSGFIIFVFLSLLMIFLSFFGFQSSSNEPLNFPETEKKK